MLLNFNPGTTAIAFASHCGIEKISDIPAMGYVLMYIIPNGIIVVICYDSTRTK